MADFKKDRYGFFGTYVINGEGVHVGNFTSFTVTSTAKIDSLKVAGGSGDIRNLYIQEIDKELPTGTEVVCRHGYFSEIKLGGGAVEAVLMQRDPTPIAVPEMPEGQSYFKITSCPGVIIGDPVTIFTDGNTNTDDFVLEAGQFLQINEVEGFTDGCYYVEDAEIGGPKLDPLEGTIVTTEEEPCYNCLENANSFIVFPCEGEEGEVWYTDSGVGVDLGDYVGSAITIGEDCYRVEKSVIGGPPLEAPFGEECECGEEPLPEDCNGVPGGPAVLDQCGVCDGDNTNYTGTFNDLDQPNGDGTFDNGSCDCEGSIIDECGECGGEGIPDGACDCAGNELDECGNCPGDEGYQEPDDCGNCPGDEDYPCEPGEGILLTITNDDTESSQAADSNWDNVPTGDGLNWLTEAPEGENPYSYIFIKYSEEGLEEQNVQTVFESADFWVGEGLVVTNVDGQSYLKAWDFNGIGNFVPGQVYQISIDASSNIISAGVEGLEGLFSFYEPEGE